MKNLEINVIIKIIIPIISLLPIISTPNSTVSSLSAILVSVRIFISLFTIYIQM